MILVVEAASNSSFGHICGWNVGLFDKVTFGSCKGVYVLYSVV